jgi:hypothetical protein
MIITETISQTFKQDIIRSCICDRCKKEIDATDDFEFQEMQHISFMGGYGSVFGDETMVNCDLCQYCLKELIGSFARIEDNNDNG